jgi:hypothetical protein
MNPFAFWRRMMRDDGQLRLTRALEAQGLALPLEGELAIRHAAHAVRRCVACREHEACDRMLAAHDWDGLREICPNTSYIGVAATPR